jgi:hypothetical protein
MLLNSNFECVDNPGNTTLLEIIDVSWDNSASRYLYSMRFEGNVVYSAAAIPWTPVAPL